MIIDNVADLLTRIRNAGMAGHRTAKVPVSKLNKSILDLLLKEGFISGVETEEKKFNVELKYFKNGQPLLSAMQRVSKPGCRIYKKVDDLYKHRSGLGCAIISTSQGLMTDTEAKRNNVGGEVLALIG